MKYVRVPRHVLSFARGLVLGLALVMIPLASIGCARNLTHIPDSAEAIANWQTARNFLAQGRFELARQYYLVALAASHSPETQVALKDELEKVDRMIQAMR